MIPKGIDDEKVLFLSDIFPTGYMAAENCNIKRGDTVAIWGAGPVGQMAIRSAFLFSHFWMNLHTAPVVMDLFRVWMRLVYARPNRIRIDDGPEASKSFKDKKDECIKAGIDPVGLVS